MSMFSDTYQWCCEHIRCFEPIVRKFYYKVLKGHVDTDVVNNPARHEKPIPIAFSDLKKLVDSFGIKNGDILLVHSSMDALSGLDVSFNELLDYLISIVGDEGTICFPCYPLFRKSDIYIEDGQEIRKYDVRRTLCWTGMLPNLFLRVPGVIRSPFPYNPLAMKGPKAEEMIADSDRQVRPHGRYSTWEYLIEHHAKVLFLGCNLAHSLTLFHAREELYDWPVKGWFEKKAYDVIEKDGNSHRRIIEQRSDFWVTGYHGGYNARKAIKAGVIENYSELGIPVNFIPDANKYIAYLNGFRCDKLVSIPHKFIIQ